MPSHADLIVLGSGAAGLTTALTAALSGQSCLLLEHEPVLGGTSARSSGTVWTPNNRAMRAHEILDDRVEAERYLEALVADRAPRAIWTAFLDAAPKMQADLEDRAGLRFRPFESAPDYRQDMPGAASGWRALEPAPFDGRLLGADFEHLAPPLPELMLFGGMMVTRAEAMELLHADRSFRALRLAAELTLRFIQDRFSWPRGTRLVLGNALVARLLAACLERGVMVRRAVETTTLHRSDEGRIVGVAVRSGGASIDVGASRGVVLAGGGFPASDRWRGRELPKPTPRVTPASPGAVGRSIELGLEAGAALGPPGLDNALWFPSSTMRRRDGTLAVYPHIVLDRAKPGSLAVDASGRRFVNEAVSYHEFVRGMYRANARAASTPCWMIADRPFVSRYGIGLVRPRTPSLARFVREGYLKRGDSIADLARAIGVPASALEETVIRFNGFARAGRDEDFQRGETIYERANGDAAHGPNPCLGEIAQPPYFAVQLEPTPLGTSRGIATDAHARALDQDGAPVPGLYACGNDMQSAFGGEYPGAGAQLGQGMTFGWIAANCAARSEP